MHCTYRFYVYFGSSFQARFICILSSMCLCCSSHSYSHTSIRSISASLAMAKATKKYQQRTIQATWMWDETKNLFGLNEYKCLVDLVTVKWNIRPRAVDLDLFHVLSTHIHTKKERYIFRVVHSFVCCRFFFSSFCIFSIYFVHNEQCFQFDEHIQYDGMGKCSHMCVSVCVYCACIWAGKMGKFSHLSPKFNSFRMLSVWWRRQ